MPLVNIYTLILLTDVTISAIISALLHEVEASRLSEESKGVKTVLGNETSHSSGAGTS